MSLLSTWMWLFICLCQVQGDFNKEALDAHNKFRQIHKVPKMKRNNDMNSEAKKWARHLAYTHKLQHANTDERNGDGENIYYQCNMGSPSGKDVTLEWYKEVCQYNFNTGKPIGEETVGHFTQIVWKASQEFGIGKATRGDCTYVVSRYRPPGNWIGRESQNVFKGNFYVTFCDHVKHKNSL